MKNKMKNTTSLHTRMSLLFVVVIAATLLITSSFSYWQARRIIGQYQIKIADNLLDRVTFDLDSKLQRAVGITEQILYFPSVHQAVFGTEEETVSSNSQMEEYRSVVTFLRVLEEQFGYARARIFARNIGESFPQDGFRLLPYSALDQTLVMDDNINNRMEQVRFIHSYEISDYSLDSEISVIRLIVSGSEHRTIAAISLQLDCTSFFDSWTTDGEDSHLFFLINREGKILASNESDKSSETIFSPELTKELYTHSLLQTEEKSYLTRHIDDTDWLMVMDVPDTFVQEGIWSILSTNILITMAASIVAIVAVICISKTLTGRLTVLTQTIQTSSSQTTLTNALKLHIEENGRDCTETAVLIHSYNEMLERIRLLGEENTHMAVRENRYRMEALRLQINSHFLYNTLASIKGYIEINEVSEASRLVMELSDFFKYSLGGKSVCIPLREELQLVTCYLHIQQIVYDNTFSYEIQVSEEIMDFSIPKFLLQPIVENAVIHGISEVYHHGIIRLIGTISEETVCIRIEDNGPGFTAKMLEEQQTANTEKNGMGVGMNNVLVRLKLYFGQKAHLRIDNLPSGGGCVTLILPKEGMSSSMLLGEEKDR